MLIMIKDNSVPSNLMTIGAYSLLIEHKKRYVMIL